MDAHTRPPEPLRVLFKKWQKSRVSDIEVSDDILDFTKLGSVSQVHFVESFMQTTAPFTEIFTDFLSTNSENVLQLQIVEPRRYEIEALPGLSIYPALLPIAVQIELLNKLIHRDLSNEAHKTNLHLHYDVPYPISNPIQSGDRSAGFFNSNPTDLLDPKDASVHKPITVHQMLERKLRWMTLGGQYDWTAKVYPSEKPPDFPPDIGKLVRSIWPDINPQAAIVNFYTPGDTLSVHRDVSEECDRGLVSISIGCDGIFIIGNSDGSKHVTLRLRSGDALLMSGDSRFAWHAVPKILPQTCPREIHDWPAIGAGSSTENWKGWLNNKRINLNIRQMRTD